MKRSVLAVLVWSLAFLLPGCGRSTDERAADLPFLVNLDLSVALSDIAVPESRVSPDAAPANDDEKMQTLRIIVVRPDGTVEANRFVKPSVALLYDRQERFKVVGREKKRIYLFVNEGNTFVETMDGDPVATGGRLSEYLSAIGTGTPFPSERLASLVIRLKGDSTQLSGALPMNESHEIEVGATDCSFELFVTRAAVKFTYRITNNSSDQGLLLTGLSIDKMARREYYMPHGTVYADNEEGIREIVRYDAVPAEYYTFGYSGKTAAGTGVELPYGKSVELPPIYLLEGKYEDPYAMSLSVNGVAQSRFFPALPQLPRNTHVVVNIDIRSDAKVLWEVDVVPYDEVPLFPEFGV